VWIELSNRELELIVLAIRQYRGALYGATGGSLSTEHGPAGPAIAELDRIRDRIENKNEEIPT